MDKAKLTTMDRAALVSITLALAAEVAVLQASERLLIERIDQRESEVRSRLLADINAALRDKEAEPKPPWVSLTRVRDEDEVADVRGDDSG